MAAAVMLAAVLFSLFALATPSGPAGAAPGTPTNIAVTLAVSCNNPSSIQVTFGAFTDPAAVPVRVRLQLVPNSQSSISSSLGSGIGVPTYVNAAPGNVVWLNGAVDAVNPQSVLIQADNYDAAVVAQPVPTTCDPTVQPPIAPTDLGLAAPTLASPQPILVTAAQTTVTCNADGTGSASIDLTVNDPNSSVPAAFQTAPDASGGMTELDYGVYVTDSSGAIVSPPASSLAQFPTATFATSINLPTFSIALGVSAPLTGYQVWMVGTDGVAASGALTLDSSGISPCQPAPAPSASSSPATSSSANTPATSDAPTSPSSSDSPSSVPSQDTSPVPVVSPVVSSPPPILTPESPGPSLSTTQTSLVLSSPPASPSIPGVVAPPLPTSPTPLELSSTANKSGAPPVQIQASGAVTIQGTKQLAGGDPTTKSLQILRWHGDAAIVVGFDAMAVFSLVGATVWSARRR